jgi:hypothetical protein
MQATDSFRLLSYGCARESELSVESEIGKRGGIKHAAIALPLMKPPAFHILPNQSLPHCRVLSGPFSLRSFTQARLTYECSIAIGLRFGVIPKNDALRTFARCHLDWRLNLCGKSSS